MSRSLPCCYVVMSSVYVYLRKKGSSTTSHKKTHHAFLSSTILSACLSVKPLFLLQSCTLPIHLLQDFSTFLTCPYHFRTFSLTISFTPFFALHKPLILSFLILSILSIKSIHLKLFIGTLPILKFSSTPMSHWHTPRVVTIFHTSNQNNFVQCHPYYIRCFTTFQIILYY